MKGKLMFATASAATLMLAACGGPAKTASVTTVGEGLRFCESTYPYDGSVLIANFGTEELNPLNGEGKGYIVRYKAGEAPQVVVPADGNLSAPKGMFLRDGRLFVCDVNKLVVYDLNRPGEAPQVVPFPEGELFVNDLTADGDLLYASVTNTGRIFRLDISDLSAVGAPEPWLEIPGPNGLVIRDGAMYVASYPADGQTTDAHVIYRIADLANPVAEPFVALPGQYDGIAFSGDGKSLYVTNWSPAGLSRIDLETRAVEPVAVELEQPLVGPADLTVADGMIYLPDLPNSRVVVFAE